MSRFDSEQMNVGQYKVDFQRARWRECRRDLTDFIRFNLESHPHRSGCPFSVLKQFFPWGRYNVEFSVDFLRRSQALKVDELDEMVHLLPQADEVLFRTWGEKLLKVKVSSPWFKSIAPGQTRVLTFSVRNYSSEIRTLVACYIEEDQLNIFSLWGEFGKADQHHNKVIQPGRTDVRVQLQCKAPFSPTFPFLAACVRFVFQERPGPGKRIHVVKIVKVPVNFRDGGSDSPRNPSPWNVAEDAEVYQEDLPVGLTLADRQSSNNAPQPPQAQIDERSPLRRRSIGNRALNQRNDFQQEETIADKWDCFNKAANRGMHQQQSIVTENGVLTYVLHGGYDFEEAPVAMLRALLNAPLTAETYRIKMLSLLMFEAQSLKKILTKKRLQDQIPINQITVHGAILAMSGEENFAKWRLSVPIEDHPILQEICEGDLVFVAKDDQKFEWKSITVCQITNFYQHGFQLEGVPGSPLTLDNQERCCLHIVVLTGRHPLTHNCKTLSSKGYILDGNLHHILFPTKTGQQQYQPNDYEEIYWSEGLTEQQKQHVYNIVFGVFLPGPYLINSNIDTSGEYTTLLEAVVQLLTKQPKCSVLVCGTTNKSLDVFTSKLLSFPQMETGDVLRLLSQSTQMGNVPLELSSVASSISRDAKVVICTCMVAARMQNRSERNGSDFTHVFFVDAHLTEEPLTFQVIAAILPHKPPQEKPTSVVLYGETDKPLTFGYSKVAASKGLATPFIQRVNNVNNQIPKQSFSYWEEEEELDFDETECYFE